MITKEDIVDGAVFVNPNYDETYPKCLLVQSEQGFKLTDPADNTAWEYVDNEDINEMIELWNDEGIQKWTGENNA